MDKKDKILGTFYFIFFIFLIISGIVQKRIYNIHGFMMLWHVPAAVFLILAGKKWSQIRRNNYFYFKKN